MMELSHFYGGWTLDYIRGLSLTEVAAARNYMVEFNKQQNQREGGTQPNGQRRH